VKATYKDGILEIRVPVAKTEEETAIEVPIRHS
jgi:HSP20 family molecular chaperone IbpA